MQKKNKMISVKTNYIIFSYQRKLRLSGIKMNNIETQNVYSIKFSGVI